MNQPNKLPQEERLNIFVGSWANTGKLMPGPFGPGGSISGVSTYEWAINGKWLLYTSQLNLPGMGLYVVHGGVSYNSQIGIYAAYAANSLGNLIVYDGEWTDKAILTFINTYPKPTESARVSYQINPDGTITFTSDRRMEDGEFETYFRTDMQRQ